MNKLLKIAVWAFLVSILVSGIGIIKNAFALGTEPGTPYPEEMQAIQKAQHLKSTEDYDYLSHQYNLLYADSLVEKLGTIHKNTTVVLFLKDGTKVYGTYKGYVSYDGTVFIKQEGHWLSDGYSINDLQEVAVSVKEKV